jgi:hypothetical protein
MVQVLGYVTLLEHVPGPPLVGPVLLPVQTTPVHAVLAEAVPVYPVKHVPQVLVTVEQGFLLSEAQKLAEAPEQSVCAMLQVRPSAANV